MSIKVMSIFGTRPEAIKMAPVIKVLEKDARFQSTVVVTGQHRDMLDQVLDFFEITPDFDLNIMKDKQALSDMTIRIIKLLTPILEDHRPDIVLVHGDTTTTLAAALSAYYQQISIGHVEAGLRTWQKYSPFPEEMNRQLVDALSDLHFAPTQASSDNLLKENHSKEHIFVTGNTAIDAMSYTIDKDYSHPNLLNNDKRKLLVTMHRRENLGEPMIEVFQALTQLAKTKKDVEIIFPMHKNPVVRQLAEREFGGLDNIQLIEPLDLFDFHNFVQHCDLILTDSGGVQEEAPSLGVPVLVLRDTTERPEGIQAGTLKLVGTKKEIVFQEAKKLLESTEDYQEMASAVNPYGDGHASERIADILAQAFNADPEGQKKLKKRWSE
ncbi:UDP-N-acetylglucosamine 2-epimerase (non-hydrolyzing) [Enterococcus hulanensis]|uniref:non-hydrolyzing UDP-N-acetylglucosamine 2-epimerase n=1 Tax=Enterococcus hulanensis TaxID=2559929 RepID=UPI001A8ECBDF|nr:UDP-N-acetylglucosamine 2-epimerase (non-hydrolyzing) [Enterococcus hulanensis]MBO0458253.1 UDP-N-acetylglucosamine 2-epimerase (non-hydrolyzing) [Enterococcus hulanensis]